MLPSDAIPRSARIRYALRPNVAWSRDHAEPQFLLERTFKGAAIKAQGSVNWSLLDYRAIDAAMTRAAAIEAGPERYEAWAAINGMIVEVVAIPYVWDDSFQLASAERPRRGESLLRRL